MRTASLLLIALCLSLQAAAQVPESPNKVDDNGKRIGQWTLTFDSAWKPATDPALIRYYRILNYKDGHPTGVTHDYFLSGKLQTEGVMLNDDPEVWDGIVIGYFEDGTKNFELVYKDSAQTGLQQFWYENGKKQAEVPMVNGKRHGTIRFWDPAGNLNVTEWKDDKRVK